MTSNNSANAAADGISMVAIAKRIALVVVFLWFFLGCVPHFKATAMEMSIMPSYIPYPREMVLISGAFELLGAIGISIPRTRRAAGVGLLLLTIAVTPANVFMLQHAERYGWPMWLLIFRLPFQVFLLWLIWWSTWNTFVRVAGQST
ncbi:MAG: hypothetical protein QOF42_2230 [Gammaproteobacteria bacterium]|jgi:uncharacterized membrane protein|nr:hypothetical protein [Gammaproteobacteria bacterium]